jgi:hypothetical protein
MSKPPIFGGSASHEVRFDGGRALARGTQPRVRQDGAAAASTDVAHIPAVARLGSRLGAGGGAGADADAAAAKSATPTRRDPTTGALEAGTAPPIDYTLPQALRARMDKLRIVNAAVSALVSGLPRPAEPPSAARDETSAAARSAIPSSTRFSTRFSTRSAKDSSR